MVQRALDGGWNQKAWHSESCRLILTSYKEWYIVRYDRTIELAFGPSPACCSRQSHLTNLRGNRTRLWMISTRMKLPISFWFAGIFWYRVWFKLVAVVLVDCDPFLQVWLPSESWFSRQSVWLYSWTRLEARVGPANQSLIINTKTKSTSLVMV